MCIYHYYYLDIFMLVIFFFWLWRGPCDNPFDTAFYLAVEMEAKWPRFDVAFWVPNGVQSALKPYWQSDSTTTNSRATLRMSLACNDMTECPFWFRRKCHIALYRVHLPYCPLSSVVRKIPFVRSRPKTKSQQFAPIHFHIFIYRYIIYMIKIGFTIIIIHYSYDK